MDKSALEYIDTEHLGGLQREIADVIGIENFRKLCSFFGGEKLYIPKPDSLIIKNKAKIIKQISTDSNHNQICRVFGISRRELNNIISGTK